MARPKKIYEVSTIDRATAALLVLEHHQGLLNAAVAALRAVHQHRPQANLALSAGQKYMAESEAESLQMLARTLGLSVKKQKAHSTLRRRSPNGGK